MEVTLKAGIYLAVNNITKDEYIIAFAGKAPMLVIVNVIFVKNFCNGTEADRKEKNEVFTEMIVNPENFTYTEVKANNLPAMSLKNAQLTETPEPTGDQFLKWVEIAMKTDGSITDLMVAILNDLKCSPEIASEWVTRVNIRRCELQKS